VGQLTGGTGADCGGGTDYYGKISKSWSNSTNDSYNLKAWLDPSNTGVYTLDGTYDGGSIIYGCTDSSACNYESDATNDDGSCEYSSCTGSVILNFGIVDGSAGTAEIYMQNDVPIAGFQFVINDSPNYLDLISVSDGSASDYGFTISSSESGTIVGFTLTGTSIPAGSGNLLIATFGNNTNDQTFDLCLSDPVFSDTNANGVNVTLGSCSAIEFSSSIPGDLNDDGLVNVLDVVVLVNMVLGISEQNYSGDLNNDNLINVLDVVILVNMILAD